MRLRDTAIKRWLKLIPFLALLMMSWGCSTVRVTDPPRTATEQFLLTLAASRAVDQLSFDALRGRKVYVETRYYETVEEPFIIGDIRAKALLAGVQLVETREEAQIIMELRSAGVGIDREDFLLGIPPILITGGGEDADVDVPIVTPEVALTKNINQTGVASVAYVAYWADTGEVVASSGPYIGLTVREDWWFLGWGPRSVGNIPTTEDNP